jgi:uncharacterized peroxidase-related enzyme
MTFIDTVPESEATGAVAEMYAADRELTGGDVRNLAKAFSAAPDIYAAWVQLNTTIKARMDLRRYELATLAAARRVRSSYCALAHGSVLMSQFLDGDELRAVMADHHAAGLDPVETAVMDLADKVADDATCVTETDIERLRDLGLSDAEILEVVSAAAARCFFSKALDALGVEADASYAKLDPSVRDALVIGRPIASA